MVTVIIIQLIVVTLLAISLVRGIDKHQTEYPDYTGDDFLKLDGKPFNYNEDEPKEGGATIEDGLEDELQFRGTAVPTVPFQGSHRVALTMNRGEAAPIMFTPEMLREIKQRETTMWGRNNNDNPDTTTTGETNATSETTDKITTITDETSN